MLSEMFFFIKTNNLNVFWPRILRPKNEVSPLTVVNEGSSLVVVKKQKNYRVWKRPFFLKAIVFKNDHSLTTVNNDPSLTTVNGDSF